MDVQQLAAKAKRIAENLERAERLEQQRRLRDELQRLSGPELADRLMPAAGKTPPQ